MNYIHAAGMCRKAVLPKLDDYGRPIGIRTRTIAPAGDRLDHAVSTDRLGSLMEMAQAVARECGPRTGHLSVNLKSR